LISPTQRPDDPARVRRWPGGFQETDTIRIAAFPDLRFTTEPMVADNDPAGAFNKVSGTHHGEFKGIPATS